jgi:Ceramidase
MDVMDVKHLHLPTARTVHDRQSDIPFWGIPTATIDWCEESMSIHSFSQKLILNISIDYTITPYIAEFVNTTTNAFFSILHIYMSGLVNKQCPWLYFRLENPFNKSIMRGFSRPKPVSFL